jgi:fructokinase
MKHVLIGGEALIDLTVSADGKIAAHPGGGPYNVARTIGRLGQPVGYLGCVSTDRFGRELLCRLVDDGVDLDCVVETDAPTTLALAELDDAGSASYRFYSAGTAAPSLSADAWREPAAIFYVGTLGLVFEPLATTLERFALESPAGTLVVLDPNCRPLAIRDGAAYRARLDRLQARADLIKVSADDLAWLAPGVATISAARAMLTGEEGVALVTLGADGARIVTRRDALEVAAPAVDVVDSIGAGDAFVGAFLAHWSARGFGRDELASLSSVRDATEFACEVAAMTCARAGADPPRMATR